VIDEAHQRIRIAGKLRRSLVIVEPVLLYSSEQFVLGRQDVIHARREDIVFSVVRGV